VITALVAAFSIVHGLLQPTLQDGTA